MKKISFCIDMLCLIASSCKKPFCAKDEPVKLAGSWRMVAVKSDQSPLVITRPASDEREVEISFSASNDTQGELTGHTPTNTIVASDYLTSPNQGLTVAFLNMTKVQETSWGSEFAANIRDAQRYSIG